jgi:flavin-dependent dehydrogenase
MPIKCDVLIIGAGPAGLFAALILSNKGFSTIVIEKNENGVSNYSKYDITEGTQICEILNKYEVKPKKKSLISEWVAQNYSYILHSKIEDFYFKRGSEKDSLENLLFEKLNENFASVYFKSKVDSIKLKDKEVSEVNIDRYNKKIKIKPKYVIVADGPNSDFRKKMDLKTNIFAKFNGFGILIELDKNDIIPHAKIYFNQKIAPGGYIYSGSVGKEAFFCIFTDDLFNNKNLLKQHLKNFVKKNIKEDFTVKNYFDGTGKSGIQEVIISNVLFIGGAALFYEPFLGYGLNYAIESAYFAANSIEKNDFDIYSKYAEKVQQNFKDMFFAREIWRQADNNFFKKLIKSFNGEFNTNDNNINKISKLFY